MDVILINGFERSGQLHDLRSAPILVFQLELSCSCLLVYSTFLPESRLRSPHYARRGDLNDSY
jgi:hypothetical protein